MTVETAAFEPGIRTLRPPRGLRSLCMQEQMDLAIHRERARADRGNQEFSLVLFRWPRSIGPSRSIMRLARLLLQRARTADDIGWFDPNSICALLPDTSAAGAAQFVDNLCLALRDSLQRPQAMVYTYPSAWMPDGPEALFAPIPSPAARQGPRKSAPGRAAALESLLVRPMPYWKRVLDILGASLALLLAWPAMLLVAVGIRLTSPGPVFFVQRRAGLGGRPFNIFKFRTMATNAEAEKERLRPLSEQDGPAFKLSDDPRVTPLGRILRQLSLDELPQLWNVLKGDMSLVGPRPLPIDEQEGCDQWHRRRLDVTPGLTCIWQIKGRSQVTFAEWVRMDMAYIRRRTFWHDLTILLQTVPAVLLRKGAK